MIDDIITFIDEAVQDCIQIENSIYHGRSLQIKVKDATYPVIFEDRKFKKICISDMVDFQSYHKIKRVSSSPSEDYSFGKKIAYEHEYECSMIGILKNVTDIDPSIVETIPNSFPSVISNSDYKKIDIEITGINLHDIEQDTIVTREFGKIDYGKHKCKFYVFETLYKISAVNCNACVNLGNLLFEDGSDFLLEDYDYMKL